MKKIISFILASVMILAMAIASVSAAELTTPEAILDAAYALEQGASLEGTYTLTGVITEINTAYSEQYKNISVTIQVGEIKDKPIQCYRLKGDGAESLKFGDTITVTGEITNYKGLIEFKAGCTLDSVISAAPAETEPFVEPTTPAEIMAAASALKVGETLPGTYTLNGTIVSVDTTYSEQYKNITVTIEIGEVEGKPVIQCFRLKGEGAESLKVGDAITVTGAITNYNGKIQYNANSTFVLASAPVEPEVTEAPATDAPETDAPAPDTTAPESSSDTGDNGVFFAAVALAVVAIAGTTIIGRKRENA